METGTQSEFNYGFSFLQRLNYWLYIAGQAAYEPNPRDWFYSLMNVYRDIADDMNDDEQEICEAFIKSINDMLSDRGQDVEFDLFMELHNFEKALKVVIRNCGYKTKFSDDPSQAIR